MPRLGIFPYLSPYFDIYIYLPNRILSLSLGLRMTNDIWTKWHCYSHILYNPKQPTENLILDTKSQLPHISLSLYLAPNEPKEVLELFWPNSQKAPLCRSRIILREWTDNRMSYKNDKTISYHIYTKCLSSPIQTPIEEGQWRDLLAFIYHTIYMNTI